MRYCKRYKLNVDEEFNCENCPYWHLFEGYLDAWLDCAYTEVVNYDI